MQQDGSTSSWAPSSLIEPDCVLPEQFFAHDRVPRHGARALLWAVFIDGIRTYCAEVGRPNGLAYREAAGWIFRPDSEAATSFSTLCLLFEIDARQLRRR